MTVILKLGQQNFRPQNYFRQELQRYFIDENDRLSIFSYRKTACIIKNADGKQNVYLNQKEGK